jgi:S-(hydroxymethyl)glutathione dehydrogenase/alcohol dehydrogenase
VRAAIFGGTDEGLGIEDVELLTPGPHDVVVQMTGSGLCHSDLSVLDGVRTSPISPPWVLGHEGTGVVLEVGGQVSRLKVGDRVVGSFVPVCGECRNCVHGRTNLCVKSREVMLAPRVRRSDGSEVPAMAGLGTFAEIALCHAASLVAVDTDLPDSQLALLGCSLTTGVGAVLNTARLVPGSLAVVFGCGGVGQAVIQGARIAGASRIVAVDPLTFKRQTALALGATDAVDPADGAVPDQIAALTRGAGADYAFEVTGRAEIARDAVAVVRPGGLAVLVGLASSDVTVAIPMYSTVVQEKRIAGSMYGSADVRSEFPRLISFIEAGRLDVGSMVSRTLKLEQINEGYELLREGSVIRAVVTLST